MKKEIVVLSLIFLYFFLPCGSQDFEALMDEGDIHWQSRDQISSLNKALTAYKKAYEIVPCNRVLLDRLSYGFFFQGYYDFPGKKNREKRKQLFLNGMAYAKNMLDRSPDDPHANFRYVVNKLCYRKEMGIISSASLLPEIKKRLNIVMEKTPYLESGGPQRLISSIIMEVPGWLRSTADFGTIEEAGKMLKDAIEYDSHYLLNYILLADIYKIQKRKDRAKDVLLKVIDAKIDPEYKYAAECRKHKKIAAEKIRHI